MILQLSTRPCCVLDQWPFAATLTSPREQQYINYKGGYGESVTRLYARFFALHTIVGVTRARPDARRHSHMTLSIYGNSYTPIFFQNRQVRTCAHTGDHCSSRESPLAPLLAAVPLLATTRPPTSLLESSRARRRRRRSQSRHRDRILARRTDGARKVNSSR